MRFEPCPRGEAQLAFGDRVFRVCIQRVHEDTRLQLRSLGEFVALARLESCSDGNGSCSYKQQKHSLYTAVARVSGNSSSKRIVSSQ